MKNNHEKKITYYNEDEQVEITINKADLQEVDFDTDVDFNLDSASVNQDIISQRWISLLEQAKTIPQVADLPAVWQKTMREAFKVSNPESYTVQQQQPEMMPGEQEAPVEGQENPEQPTTQQPMGQQLAPDAGMGGVYG